MVKGAVTQATTTIDILKTIPYKVSLRKVDSKHVKHKVLHYLSAVPVRNAWTK